MDAEQMYAIAADAVLVLHAGVVVFVVTGAVGIGVGGLAGWSWVRHRGLRIVHLFCIAVVVLQSWVGAVCPLTTLETALRRRAGDIGYQDAFIAHWLGRVVYHQAPQWVFVAVYTAFGAVVVACWVWVRPLPARRDGGRGG